MMAHRFGIGTLDDLVPTPGGRRSPGEGAGTGPVPLCCSAFELAQHKSEESMGILAQRLYMQGPTSPGALANPDHPWEMALYSRWSQLPSSR
jgi:hypothetical protein